jgi:hypothetical protein
MDQTILVDQSAATEPDPSADWMPTNMRTELERIAAEATGDAVQIPKWLRTNPELRKVVKEITEIGQSSALGEVLRAAYIAARERIPVNKGKEAAAKWAEMLREATALRKVADDLVARNPSDPLAQADAAAIRRGADWWQAGAESLRKPGDPFVVKHDYGDPVERGVLTAIVRFFEHRFGQPLYRTAATLAAIVLGREKVSIHAARCAASKQTAV